MLIRRSFAAALLAAAAPPLAATAGAQIGVQRERNAPSVYAITNARIVPGTGPTIEKGTVVVRDGVIAAVGASATAPADARVIDGTGLTVYAGFIESAGSLGIPAPRQPQGGGQGGGQGGPFAAPPAAQSAPSAPNSLHPAGQQPELTVVDLLRPDADAFTAAHSAGFTSALTAPASGIFVGQSAVIELRDGTAQDILLKSPIALHIGFNAGRGFGGGYPNSLMGVFAVLRQMLLDAQHYGAEMSAYAANPRGMTRPSTDLSLEALQPVLARRIPVVMQANSQREIERALDLAKEFNLRPIITGGQEAYKVAARLKAENVPVLLAVNFPTRPSTRAPDADPEPLRVLRERVEAPRSPAKLADAGVRTAIQSGGSYAEFLGNVQKAVENGLGKAQALRALTLTPAELLGVSDRLGTVEAGKIANLTVVRGDVFERGSRVTHVFVDGKPIEVKAPAASASTTAMAAGNWTVTVTLDGTDRSVTMGIQQSGEQLRGTMQGTLGTGPLNNGSIGTDGAFRFTATVTIPAGTEEATFTGTINGNTMRGTVTIVGHDPGTFVGTRPNGGRS